MLLHIDVREKVNYISEFLLVQFRTGEVLRENAFEAVVLLLNKSHRLINFDADFGGMSIRSNHLPTSILRNPEYALAGIFIFILFHPIALCYKFIMTLLEPVRDILQKDESKNHMLVLGSIHAAPKLVCRTPDLFLKSDIGRIGLCHMLLCVIDFCILQI